MRNHLYVVGCIFVLMFGCALLASAGTITDNLNDGKIDDWTILSGVWTAKDGVLHETEMGGPKVIVWNTPGELKDFTITVKAMGLSADADWGVVFRAKDVNNFYSWQYCNSALEFVSYVAGTRAETNLQAQAAILNEWQEFKVVASGNSYTLSWKGKEIKTIENAALTGGKVGFFTWDVVDFDDFVVTSDSIISTTAVSPKARLSTTWGDIKAY